MPLDGKLAADLLAWAAEDLAVRRELVDAGELFEGYHPRMQAVHDRNAERLEAALAETGWPGASRVGEQAAQAAWLIAQHAIGRPSFFRRCAALLQAAAAKGDAPAWQAVMMTDRIRALEGAPQIYGTSFDWDENGELSPYPIEEPETVDERRRAVGLPPLAEKLAEMRERAKREGERRPADYRARRAAAEQWAKDVGWR